MRTNNNLDKHITQSTENTNNLTNTTNLKNNENIKDNNTICKSDDLLRDRVRNNFGRFEDSPCNISVIRDSFKSGEYRLNMQEIKCQRWLLWNDSQIKSRKEHQKFMDDLESLWINYGEFENQVANSFSSDNLRGKSPEDVKQIVHKLIVTLREPEIRHLLLSETILEKIPLEIFREIKLFSLKFLQFATEMKLRYSRDHCQPMPRNDYVDSFPVTFTDEEQHNIIVYLKFSCLKDILDEESLVHACNTCLVMYEQLLNKKNFKNWDDLLKVSQVSKSENYGTLQKSHNMFLDEIEDWILVWNPTFYDIAEWIKTPKQECWSWMLRELKGLVSNFKATDEKLLQYVTELEHYIKPSKSLPGNNFISLEGIKAIHNKYFPKKSIWTAKHSKQSDLDNKDRVSLNDTSDAKFSKTVESTSDQAPVEIKFKKKPGSIFCSENYQEHKFKEYFNSLRNLESAEHKYHMYRMIKPLTYTPELSNYRKETIENYLLAKKKFSEISNDSPYSYYNNDKPYLFDIDDNNVIMPLFSDRIELLPFKLIEEIDYFESLDEKIYKNPCFSLVMPDNENLKSWVNQIRKDLLKSVITEYSNEKPRDLLELFSECIKDISQLEEYYPEIAYTHHFHTKTQETFRDFIELKYLFPVEDFIEVRDWVNEKLDKPIRSLRADYPYYYASQINESTLFEYYDDIQKLYCRMSKAIKQLENSGSDYSAFEDWIDRGGHDPRSEEYDPSGGFDPNFKSKKSLKNWRDTLVKNIYSDFNILEIPYDSKYMFNLQNSFFIPDFFLVLTSLYSVATFVYIASIAYIYGLMFQKALSECYALTMLMFIHILFRDDIYSYKYSFSNDTLNKTDSSFQSNLPASLRVFFDLDETIYPYFFENLSSWREKMFEDYTDKMDKKWYAYFASSLFDQFNLLRSSSFMLNDSIVIDSLGKATKIIICLSSAIYFLIVSNYLKLYRLTSFEYLVIIVFSIIGHVLLCSSNDLLISYLSLELSSLTSYILAAFKKKSSYSVESGLKYFITGSISSAFFLLGSSFLYGESGGISFNYFASIFLLEVLHPELVDWPGLEKFQSMTSHSFYLKYKTDPSNKFLTIKNIPLNNFELVDRHLSAKYCMDNPEAMAFSYNWYMFQPELYGLKDISLSFIFFSLFIKLGLAPFHLWSLDVYEGSPTTSTFFFAVVSKLSVLVLFYRISHLSFNYTMVDISYLKVVASVASIFVGSFGGLQTKKLKTMLSYSSINQMGYAFLTFSSSWSLLALESLLFYMIIYVISGLSSWYTLLSLELKTKIKKEKHNPELSEFTLLSSSNSAIANAFSLILFSTAGLPPLVGFLAKIGVLMVFMKSGFGFFHPESPFLSPFAIDSLIFSDNELLNWIKDIYTPIKHSTKNFTLYESHESIFVLSILIILCSIVSTFYYIRVVKVMYFENIWVGLLYYSIKNKKTIIFCILVFLTITLFFSANIVYLGIHPVSLLSQPVKQCSSGLYDSSRENWDAIVQESYWEPLWLANHHPNWYRFINWLYQNSSTGDKPVGRPLESLRLDGNYLVNLYAMFFKNFFTFRDIFDSRNSPDIFVEEPKYKYQTTGIWVDNELPR